MTVTLGGRHNFEICMADSPPHWSRLISFTPAAHLACPSQTSSPVLRNPVRLFGSSTFYGPLPLVLWKCALCVWRLLYKDSLGWSGDACSHFDALVKDLRGCCNLWMLTGRGIVLRDKRVWHMVLIKRFLPNEALRIWAISVHQVPLKCHSSIYSVWQGGLSPKFTY